MQVIGILGWNVRLREREIKMREQSAMTWNICVGCTIGWGYNKGRGVSIAQWQQSTIELRV